MWSYNPHGARSISLGSSLFARHYLGNHYYFLFLLLLRCFSSEGWLPALRRDDTPSVYRVVPFGNPRIYRLCAAPRGLSQLTTSFIVSQSQGIHHTPLSALKELLPLLVIYNYKYLLPICQRTLFNLKIWKCINLKIKYTPFKRTMMMLRLRTFRPYADIIYFKSLILKFSNYYILKFDFCGGYRSRTDDP